MQVSSPAVECGTGRAVSRNELGSAPVYWATEPSSLKAALSAISTRPQGAPQSVAAFVAQALPDYPTAVIVSESMTMHGAQAPVNSSTIVPFVVQQNLVVSGVCPFFHV